LNGLLLSLTILGLASGESSRVVDGNAGNIANFPWQASLRNLGDHTCGAVLISGTRALTAAHCGGGATASYSILVGTSDRTITTCFTCVLRTPLIAFIRHPNFANNPSVGYPNDLAVATFYNIAKNVNVEYADLAAEDDGDYVGSTCTVSGWGRMQANGPLPTTLQQGSMQVISNDACIATWGANRIRPEQLCAIHPTVSVCGGDNGGPLVCGTKLVGVFSWGEANCGANFPAVFIRITGYLEWIKEQM